MTPKQKFSLPSRLEEEICSPGVKKIIVIGGIDTGKTTLIEQLADTLSSFKTGIVDLDVGQSHIGPPTTIGWAKLEGKFPGWENLRVKGIYFVGSTSPYGRLLPMLCGAKILTEEAERKCEKVILDTTGMITGPGIGLKHSLIDLIQPQIIISLEKERELTPILSPFFKIESVKIYRLPSPPQVVPKSYEKRKSYREEKFKKYFQGAKIHTFSLHTLRLRNFLLQESEGRLVSLRDSTNRDLALGIVKRMDREKGEIEILSPLPEGKEIVVISGGRLTLSLSFEEKESSL